MSASCHPEPALINHGRKPEVRQLLVCGELSWGKRTVSEVLEGRAELVVPAVSLPQAQAYLREQEVDVVLLQAHSPNCAKWVEALVAEFEVPVVAVGESDAVDAALVAGAVDFIVEPFSRQVLIRRMDLVLETAIVPMEELDWSDVVACASSATASHFVEPVAVKTAHWELCAASGEIIWSPSIARVLDPETAARCYSLSGLMAHVADEHLHQLQCALQKLADGEDVAVQQELTINGAAGQRYRLNLSGEALADEFIFGTLTSVVSDSAARLNDGADRAVDAKTSLPKQPDLERRIATMMDRLVTGVTAVMSVELGGLPRIGTHFGHDVSVSLQLAAVARLRELLPPESCLGLLDDGSIGIALENMASTNVVHKLAKLINVRLAENYYYDEQPLHIQPMVGVAVSSSDANEANELLSCAQTALEQASSEAAVQFYSDQTSSRRQDNRAEICIEAYLYNALDNGELELYYQPQVDTTTRKIIGVEALLRWTSPQLGRVAPMLFIPIAERTGLIQSIGNWVMYEAARQMAAWRAVGLGPLKVSVNLSPVQLLNDSVEQQLRRVSRQFDLPLSMFDLEVTETVAIGETEQVCERLSRIRELGATVSLDDFGTRHSALSHLQDLEVDCLKIDRKFIEKIGVGKNAVLADAIVDMAKTLEKKVIAEGVETLEQLRYLQQRGCDQIQGYYFCEPVNALTATRLLEDGYEGLLQRKSFSPEVETLDKLYAAV